MAIDIGNSADESHNSENKTAAVSFSNPKFADSPSEDTSRYFRSMDWLMRAEPHGLSRPTVVGELVDGIYEARENDNPEDIFKTIAALVADSGDIEDLKPLIDEAASEDDE